MAKNSKATVRKISEITGFSPATVSNALNMKRGVNAETAEQIFRVAAELGYSFSPKGLSCIKFVQFRRTGDIIDNSQFHPAVIDGVEAAAREIGLETRYILLNRSAPDYEGQVKQILADHHCGIILLATEMQEEDFPAFHRCKCPLVLLDGWSEKLSFDGVLINNYDAVRHAMDALLNKGHRRIGYVCGNVRIKAFRDRELGFRQALFEAGIDVNPNWIVTVGTRAEPAFGDMLAWLDQNDDLPTAFFVDNDLIAYSVMRALRERNIRIPEDISVVGFDDLQYSAVSCPELSTVHVYRHAMGREAVRRLEQLAEYPGARKFKIEGLTEYIERRSVKDLAAGEAR